MLSGVGGFLTTLLVGKLSQRFPRLTFAGYAGRIAGPRAGKVLALVLGIVFGLNAAVDLRVALKSVVGTYFVTTPTWVIALLMALTALSVTWFGIVHAARLGPLLSVILFLTFLFTFPLMGRWLQPGFLVPLLDPAPIDMSARSFWVALGAFRSGMFWAAFMPYVADPGRALRVSGWAYWAGWLAVFPAVVTPVLVFSPEGAVRLSQPFPFVVAVIRLPGFPLERLEILARLIVNLNVLYAVGFMYFVGATLLSEVFGSRQTRPFMLAVVGISLLPVVLLAAELPGEVFAGWTVIATMALAWAVFPLFWLIYWLRGLHRPQRHGGRAGA